MRVFTWISQEIKFTNTTIFLYLLEKSELTQVTTKDLKIRFRKLPKLKSHLYSTKSIFAVFICYFFCVHSDKAWMQMQCWKYQTIHIYSCPHRNINPTNDVMQKKFIIVLWLLCSAVLCHGGQESFMEMQEYFHLFFFFYPEWCHPKAAPVWRSNNTNKGQSGLQNVYEVFIQGAGIREGQLLTQQWGDLTCGWFSPLVHTNFICVCIFYTGTHFKLPPAELQRWSINRNNTILISKLFLLLCLKWQFICQSMKNSTAQGFISTHWG